DYAYAIPFYGERRPMLIDLIDEPDEIISHHYTHIIHNRDLLIAETTLSCPKGKLGILTGTASPLFNCQGEIIGAIEAIRDITELKKSEAELQASEEKYRMVVENSHDAIYIYRGNDLLFVNKVASELTGYTHDELLNKNVWDLIHPEDRDRLRESGSRRLGGETLSSVFSARILTKDGDIRIGKFFVDIVSYLGQPAILGILRDVTDQVRAEEELNAANEQLVASSEELKSQFNELAESEQRIRESEAKYRILLDESTDPIFSFFPDGTYRYVNRAFAEGVGKTADEITGRKIWDVFDRDEAEKRFSVLRTVFSSGEGKEFEVRVPRPDGDRYYVTTVIPVKDEAGLVVSAICSSKEITARKSAEEALRQANRKLNLLSGITRHDIINQLSALDGFVELLQRKTSDPALEPYFSKITEASDRIAAMIRFSEEYEKIGVLAPAWQDCRMIVDAQAQKAPLGRVRVINDLPPGFAIFADPLIERVIYNLMDNAARYGGKITMVRFFSRERDGNPVIVCEDDGIGIPNENKDQIFNVGFGENTGLGLSLSREILDITGIAIHENGQPGSGARFEITVPKGAYRFPDCGKQ
ncbi:MAG TPA: PAS domain S-box protein, partial [Methanoregulaceae archaeon]|nr:PAS domain S-box protein [Methanoregulaceae archaeon]